MEDKLIDIKYDEYYEGDNLVTIKYETFSRKDQTTYVVKKRRVEAYRIACGCSGEQERILTIIEPFTIIK